MDGLYDKALSRVLRWQTCMRKGYLVIELPNDVDDVDAEEIEGIFALVMRGVRRRVQRCMHRPMIEADIASSDRPEA